MFKKNKYELNDRKLSPHIFDNKIYNNINSYNNVESEYISPLKRSYDFSIKQNKSHLFQNENMTINKISPSHILFNKADENRYEYYLKNPYYKGEDIDDGYKHYNPEENSFKGSNYGGYIYNYYLNAPMRSDKTENWRFPPLYYFRPKYK